jgi:hypothetical protein
MTVYDGKKNWIRKVFNNRLVPDLDSTKYLDPDRIQIQGTRPETLLTSVFQLSYKGMTTKQIFSKQTKLLAADKHSSSKLVLSFQYFIFFDVL